MKRSTTHSLNTPSPINDEDSNAPHSKDIQIIKEYTATTFSVSSVASGWSMSIAPSRLIGTLHPNHTPSISQPPELS
ncbi:MAG: hypothetical protein WDO15_09595 [Bacteroidota bacterium]